MKQPRGYSEHKCAPEEWRHTPDMSGSYELDGMIRRGANKDMQGKLHDHIVGDDAYLLRTAYNRYT